MARIFISYSRKDEDFARRLAGDLDRLGADVWIDKDDIPAAINWSTAIQQGLDTSEVMILIITPDSMKSENVEAEWQYFLDQHKPLIPVLWKPPARVHFQLTRIQYIDFHTQPYDQAFARLHNELRRTAGVRLAHLSTLTDLTPAPVATPPARDSRPRRSMLTIAAMIAVLIVAAIILFLSGVLGGDGDGDKLISFREDFDDSSLFTQQVADVYVSDGWVHWTVKRGPLGYEQYVYRNIPSFSGGVRLTVRGQIDTWTNNCGIKVGIGNALGAGAYISYGWTGGGCPVNDLTYPPGPVVQAGSTDNWSYGVSTECEYWGNWQKIEPRILYNATLTLSGGTATLTVPGSTHDPMSGSTTETGPYTILYVGLTGDGDWPECSGKIDSIVVEQLD